MSTALFFALSGCTKLQPNNATAHLHPILPPVSRRWLPPDSGWQPFDSPLATWNYHLTMPLQIVLSLPPHQLLDDHIWLFFVTKDGATIPYGDKNFQLGCHQLPDKHSVIFCFIWLHKTATQQCHCTLAPNPITSFGMTTATRFQIPDNDYSFPPNHTNLPLNNALHVVPGFTTTSIWMPSATCFQMPTTVPPC